MKRFLKTASVLAAVLVCFCKEKPVDHAAVAPPAGKQEAAAPSRAPFVPPDDSAVTPPRMKAWSSCNPLLDSLTYRYADSFKTDDPAALLRYQEDFIAAQDRICVRAGLPGGFEEYTWILQSLGLEKNRGVAESANAQAF